jgi:cell wall-associated NlpC family hydrolase
MRKQWISAVIMVIIGRCIFAISDLYQPQPIIAPVFETESFPIPQSVSINPPFVEEEIPSIEEKIEDTFHPTPEELNLAHFFPEGVDQSDISKSYAGKAFMELMMQDIEWMNNIYTYADMTPEQFAVQSGHARSQVIGSYNPKDDLQDPNNPDTWVIRSFRNIRTNVTDGDGNPISAYSNVMEIMSVANVYTYFKDAEDYNLFLSHVKLLWEKSHAYSIDMSDIYYCEGCLSEEDERKRLEQEAAAEEAAIQANILANAENKNAENESLEANESKSEENLYQEQEEPESVSRVITASEGAEMREESEPETISPDKETKAQIPETMIASPSEVEAIETQEAEIVETQSESESDPPSLDERCPGHIDLLVKMRIRGIKEKNGLFQVDPYGNQKDNFEEDGWQGWTPERVEAVHTLVSQDWYQKYGITVSTISMGNPLSESEIQEFMERLPTDLSQTRKDIIRFALSSVGKVPYYWGGKAAAPNYSGNGFGVLITPDDKGRILKGLDCSGWINWVYWSVTGNPLPYESTSGLALCGKPVNRNHLQPGDIIIRTGEDAHVIMFLEWAEDGKIRCIHESSGNVNNVTVSVRDANWPYYRKLID